MPTASPPPVLVFVKAAVRRAAGLAGAAVLTLVFFMVLPLLQAINAPPTDVQELRQVDTGELPPPPPPPEEEEPPEEPEEEIEPPKLEEEPQLLDLSQLELALNPGVGSGAFAAAGLSLDNLPGTADAADALFSLGDLDQRPRVLFQAAPNYTSELRARAPGKVFVLFIVNERGRVENPTIQSSSDPIFERAALNAVKQWRFEPGKREGKPVRFRMRVPMTFPK